MRLITNFNDEFKDCVAYLEFTATNTTHGFAFTLVRAKARPLVDGVRPTLIPQSDWSLPNSDARRNIFIPINNQTEDIRGNAGNGTTAIILPHLGSAPVLPVFLQIILTGNSNFIGDNTHRNWSPVVPDDTNPLDDRFKSHYVWTNDHDPINNTRVYLRYENARGGAVGHFDLAAVIPPGSQRTRPSGSTIHNSPP